MTPTIGYLWKKIKSRVYTNHKAKYLFNRRFGFILSRLELRLNVVIVRMGFLNKILNANEAIKNDIVKVNGLQKHKNYIINKNDLISVLTNKFSPKISKFKRKSKR